MSWKVAQKTVATVFCRLFVFFSQVPVVRPGFHIIMVIVSMH